MIYSLYTRLQVYPWISSALEAIAADLCSVVSERAGVLAIIIVVVVVRGLISVTVLATAGVFSSPGLTALEPGAITVGGTKSTSKGSGKHLIEGGFSRS